MQVHQQPILCQQCQQVPNVPNIRRFHMLKPRFLRCNYVPSEIEISHLTKVLMEAEKQVEQYEKDISVLRRKLGQLEKEKIAAEAVTKQCRASLSVHRRVPVELWEMVFSRLCLSLHDYSFDTNLLPGLPAILISQVCSHWKAIAGGLPSIWSSINVHLHELYDTRLPLETYLSNSADYPLKIRIAGQREAPLTPQAVDVWQTLFKHINRCRELVMTIPPFCFNENHFDPPISNFTFSKLESLHEEYGEEYVVPGQRGWPWFWQAIQEAPKLTTVTSIYPSRPLPFSRLTTWEVRAIKDASEVYELFDALRSCDCLESLTLTEISSSSDYNLDVVSSLRTVEFELPSLRRFSAIAHQDRCGWLSSIVETLIMPLLETLHIKYGQLDLPVISLLNMIRRSSNSLKGVTLTVNMGERERFSPDFPLSDLLQSASELTHFELLVDRASPSDRPFFDDMIPSVLSRLRDHPRHFLPKLALLSLGIPGITLNPQLVKRVLGAVWARQLTTHPLTDIRLVSLNSRTESGRKFVIDPEQLTEIKLLKESRINVIIEAKLARCRNRRRY
ncbi:hypothetical protein E1B28_006993 [Marasmius oreades]|uniref:F-box domain-containing protein n=1 Tax=Marasmius oreades TaxID=181124 RepID=A0A9P7S1F5_9AGAR|nr:uncharacterized protein E1B28_006993 [Marasmius oreades]KAG7093310.1 hypothetical protein E1B28_006993 [Marasmius oreades]